MKEGQIPAQKPKARVCKNVFNELQMFQGAFNFISPTPSSLEDYHLLPLPSGGGVSLPLEDYHSSPSRFVSLLNTFILEKGPAVLNED